MREGRQEPNHDLLSNDVRHDVLAVLDTLFFSRHYTIVFLCVPREDERGMMVEGREGRAWRQSSDVHRDIHGRGRAPRGVPTLFEGRDHMETLYIST